MIKKVKDPNGKAYSVKIDPDLDFLAPFLSVARRFGIPVWKIRSVNGYRVPKHRSVKQYAAIIPNGNKFDITINKAPEQLKEVKSGCQYEMILHSFAHELSHVVHWDHTPDRFILEAKLMVAFTRLAKEKGYTGY